MRIVLVFLLMICVRLIVQAAEGTSVSEAKTSYEKGEEFRKTGDSEKAIAEFRRAIEADFNFENAHNEFIKTTRAARREQRLKLAEAAKKGTNKENTAVDTTPGPEVRFGATELGPIYQQWIMQHPDLATLRWALGKVYEPFDKNRADELFREAIAKDPKFVSGYIDLGVLWAFRDETTKAREYFKKAIELKPEDTSLLISYARTLRRDLPEYRKYLQEIITRNPKTKIAVTATSMLASSFEGDVVAQVEIYERSRREYGPLKLSNLQFPMLELFDIYAKSDPEKALALVHDLEQWFPKDADIKKLSEFQKGIVEAKQMLASSQAKKAFAKLETLKPPPGPATQLHLLKAQAVAQSKGMRQAYDLLAGIVAKNPDLLLNSALLDYGKKLGLTESQIEDELWRTRSSNSNPFKPFELISYADGKPVKLSDYRGRVVLVNFWFPSCGFCREEFPYLQKVLNKYKSRGFEVLAINTTRDEDAEVVPLMEKNGYTFLTLKPPPSPNWVRNTYNISAAPMNFLLDAEGRVIFQPGLHDPETQRILELEVETLLMHAGDAAANKK